MPLFCAQPPEQKLTNVIEASQTNASLSYPPSITLKAVPIHHRLIFVLPGALVLFAAAITETRLAAPVDDEAYLG